MTIQIASSAAQKAIPTEITSKPSTFSSDQKTAKPTNQKTGADALVAVLEDMGADTSRVSPTSRQVMNAIANLNPMTPSNLRMLAHKLGHDLEVRDNLKDDSGKPLNGFASDQKIILNSNLFQPGNTEALRSVAMEEFAEAVWSRDIGGISQGDFGKKVVEQITGQPNPLAQLNDTVTVDGVVGAAGVMTGLNERGNGIEYGNGKVQYSTGGDKGPGQTSWTRSDIYLASRANDLRDHPVTAKDLGLSRSVTRELGGENGLYRHRRTDTELHIHEESGKLVLNWEGTGSLRDLRSDIGLIVTGRTGHHREFDAVLKAANKYAKDNNLEILVTGHSLGGHHVNEHAENAATYGDKFETASYIAFSSPTFTDRANVLNIGYQNDRIYGGADDSGRSVTGVEWRRDRNPLGSHFMRNVSVLGRGIADKAGPATT